MKLLASLSLYKTSSPDVGGYARTRFFNFQTTSTKLPPPTAANGCCLPKSILANSDLTAIYGREGKKLAVSPTATISWSITGTSATACTKFTRKVKKTYE